MRKKSFSKGGVHPLGEKKLADSSCYFAIENTKELLIPLNQHLGAPSKCLVRLKESIEVGQKLGEASSLISSNIHSPLKGVVKAINKISFFGKRTETVILSIDSGQKQLVDFESDPPPPDINSLDSKEIVEKIKEAGIVGMGGASFPTAVKLSPSKDLKVDTIIINGSECEPYLTADECLMRNHPNQVVYGLMIAMKAVSAEKGIIALEDNKPEAIKALKKTISGLTNIKLVVTKSLYPQGSEKQLIEAVTNRIVPIGKLPADVGVVVQNAATAAAIYEALQFGRPLFRRIVCVSGGAIREPKNMLVPIGIKASVLVEACGGFKEDVACIIFGGPMMGKAVNSLDVPVTKGTSGILFLTENEVSEFEELECIRCGTCARVCPMGLVPVDIMNYVKYGFLDKFKEEKSFVEEINSCFECGSCTFACPARKRLTEWCRLGKFELRRLASKKKGG